MSETTSWLSAYLQLAQERRYCTRIYCTTCGARDFRQGLVRATHRAMGKPPGVRRLVGHPLGDDGVLVLAQALAQLPPPNPPQHAIHEAVMMTLHELWMACGGDEPTHARLDPVLAGSWAGEILAGMFHHEASVRADRRAHEAYGSPAATQARRAEKRRIKAEAHAARLEAKKERDGLWRAAHPFKGE